MVRVGVIFPPNQPPERLRSVAESAEGAGLDELWLWEDCFQEGGISTATAALAWTGRITVGVGLLPVPLRNVTLAAMEIATVARMFPGRFVPAIGHGVQNWMGQAGARVDSPMTLLHEYATALRSLLAGDRISVSGRYVHLDDVALDWPPTVVPPVLIGGWGPRTLALAGSVADGVVVDRPATLADAIPLVRASRSRAGRDGEPEVVCFQPIPLDTTPERTADLVRDLATTGAHRVLVFVTDEGGAPHGGSVLIDAIAAIGHARELV